ncbi:MAG: hypothetical protein ACKOH8_05995, partial [Gemmatimonadota bacterium]
MLTLRRLLVTVACTVSCLPLVLSAQQGGAATPVATTIARLVAEPASLQLRAGETVAFRVRAFAAVGVTVESVKRTARVPAMTRTKASGISRPSAAKARTRNATVSPARSW